MNKQEFIESLAEQCEFSKAEAGRVLDAILDSLTGVMADGEDISFTGFGKFSSQRRRAREGVNPRDPSQKIKIRAANVPKFKAGTALRAAVADAPASARASSSAASRRSAAAASDGANAATQGGDTSGAGGSGSSSSGAPAGWTPLGGRD